MPSSQPETLSIIIPAFNEEEAIASTISRCLAARDTISSTAGLRGIEIIVVNDGSTDNTREIASSFTDITLINLESNQGYGAAIKHGFAKATGDLLGFLDGDGTCDPFFFSSLCRTLQESRADIVTGSRMHARSRMPAVRRLGNYFFARLTTSMSSCRIKDTASGMRVIRREILPELYPLPDGLDFTPSMTCRSLLKNTIVLQEIDMPYHERTGTSKLCVFKDGLRFLQAITEISLTYRPLKLFGWTGIFLILIASLYGAGPLYSIFSHNTVAENNIYRLITVNTLLLAGLILISIGIVAERIAASLNGKNRTYTRLEQLLLSVFSMKKLFLAGPVLIFSGFLLNLGPLYDYLTTLRISYHWEYISTGALLVLTGLQLSALGFFERLIDTVVKEGKSSE